MPKNQTTELLGFVAKLTDSTYQSFEDGDFNVREDFKNYIDDVLSIQEAVDGADKIKGENISMTVQEIEQMRKDLVALMPNVPENERHDIALGISGMLAWFRIGWRRGAKEAENSLIKKIERKGIDISHLDVGV